MNTTTSSQGSRSAACHFSSRYHLDRLLPEPVRPLPTGANPADARLTHRLGRVATVAEILTIMANNLNPEVGQ